MHVISIKGRGTGEDAAYLSRMYQLRARVFADRLGWEVAVRDSREYDWFDELDPTYILCVLGDGTVAGSARILPALGPTMLEKTFPQLIGPAGYEPHARMVEISRFCVDTSLQVAAGRERIHRVTAALFAGIVEWCMFNGCDTLVAVTDVRFEKILALSRWPLRRIGPPLKIGVTTAIAGTLPADATVFQRLRPEGYRSRFAPVHRRAA